MWIEILHPSPQISLCSMFLSANQLLNVLWWSNWDIYESFVFPYYRQKLGRLRNWTNLGVGRWTCFCNIRWQSKLCYICSWRVCTTQLMYQKTIYHLNIIIKVIYIILILFKHIKKWLALSWLKRNIFLVLLVLYFAD